MIILVLFHPFSKTEAHLNLDNGPNTFGHFMNPVCVLVSTPMDPGPAVSLN